MYTFRPASYLVALAAVALLAFAAPAQSQSDKEKAAAAFIEDLANQTVAILKKDASEQELKAAMADVLEANVAISRIGRVVAGQYLRRMTPAQRKAYDEMYREWVISTVVSRFRGYADIGWVLKQTFVRKKDVIVRTLITDPGSNETVNCDWRVRDIKGQLQILDVSVSGISMVATQKAEFADVLRRDGIDGLLAQLQIQISKD